MTGRRHLLIVAAQCEHMAPLPLLESAAAELNEVLLDPELGACQPGLPDGRSLCAGPLAAREVLAEIHAAIEYAAKSGATLVLALLGHGFTPGGTHDLHMMVAGTHEGDTLGAVCVATVFDEAADRLGLTGVLGIVDTCSAAAAIPGIGRLLQGNAEGRTRIAMLLAAAVQEQAIDFRLARGLAGLLRTGVLDGDRYLDIHTAHGRLISAKDGYWPVKFDYDGSRHQTALWLGHNRQHGHAVGRSGRDALVAALAKLTPPHTVPAKWTAAALQDLQQELAGVAESAQKVRTQRTVDNLLVAMRTTDMLQTLLPDTLDTPRLRRAIASAGITLPVGMPTDDVAELVEQVALSHPAHEETCRVQVARFVMALAGPAGKPFDSPEIIKWAQAVNATIQVNDAITWARELRETRRLRLIVSLHASNTGDWPEMLETWLLLDGRIDNGGRRRIPCTADQAGVELAIVDAVEEAEERAYELRLPLDRIEVAVPTKLLLEWQPEKIDRGEWIGTDFHVVMRWSERLNPPKEVKQLRKSNERRLRNIGAHTGGAPVDWLNHVDAHDLASLKDKLRRGRYGRAVALDHRPPHGEHLFSLLLAHVPIVLWPQPTCEHPLENHQCLDVCWDRMPDELILAYRREWQDDADEPIAKLRAVWDDKEWLDFCRSYQRGISGLKE